ncbi:MAG: response regulator, partial [Thiovulaceae bacterium]|nr:response regulator [Sulfurimonadaceae bacterium]
MKVFDSIQEMTEQCQSLNLLYVEDDQEISAITAEVLTPFFNSITLAYDGIQGLEAFKKESFDIVLTDIVMPRLDGLALCRKIREINPLQAIMVMSAFEEMEYFRESIKIGISNFIAKPSEFQHLLDSFISTALNINNVKKVALLTQELKKDLYVSKELLHHIIDTVPVRIFWKDTDSRYLGCNALFAQDAGLSSPSKIVGKTDHDLTWGDEASPSISDDQHVMDNDISNLDYEEMNIQPNGERQWLTMSKVPLHGEGRELIGVLGTYVNITALKEAMNDIQLAKDAL